MMRGSWIAGLSVGGGIGLLFGVFPSLAALLFLAFVGPAVFSRHRQAAIGGLFIGIPALWLTLVAVANANCTAFDAAPNQDCIAPDLTGWGAFALSLLLVGLIASADLVRRRRGPSS
jgi:hypothetical protein